MSYQQPDVIEFGPICAEPLGRCDVVVFDVSKALGNHTEGQLGATWWTNEVSHVIIAGPRPDASQYRCSSILVVRVYDELFIAEHQVKYPSHLDYQLRDYGDTFVEIAELVVEKRSVIEESLHSFVATRDEITVSDNHLLIESQPGNGPQLVPVTAEFADRVSVG